MDGSDVTLGGEFTEDIFIYSESNDTFSIINLNNEITLTRNGLRFRTYNYDSSKYNEILTDTSGVMIIRNQNVEVTVDSFGLYYSGDYWDFSDNWLPDRQAVDSFINIAIDTSGGEVDTVGKPVRNRIAIFDDSSRVRTSENLRYDDTLLTLYGELRLIPQGAGQILIGDIYSSSLDSNLYYYNGLEFINLGYGGETTWDTVRVEDELFIRDTNVLEWVQEHRDFVLDDYTNGSILYVENDTFKTNSSFIYGILGPEVLTVSYVADIYGNYLDVSTSTLYRYNTNDKMYYFGMEDSSRLFHKVFIDSLYVRDSTILELIEEHSGTVTTSGSPAANQITYFSGAGEITGNANYKMINDTFFIDNSKPLAFIDGNDRKAYITRYNDGFKFVSSILGAWSLIYDGTNFYGFDNESPFIRTRNATTSTPLYSAYADQNTGFHIYPGNRDTACITIGGVQKVRFTSNSTDILNSSSGKALYINTTGTGNSLEIDDDGVDAFVINSTGQVFCYDSIYLKYTNPTTTFWIIGTSTGALDTGTFSGAGEALLIDLPSIQQLLKDRSNGEIKWFSNDKWHYGINLGNPDEALSSLMAGIEISLRYNEQLSEENKIQNDRLTILEQRLDKLFVENKELRFENYKLVRKLKRCKK